MDPFSGTQTFEILARNLSWMSGNLFLAWAAMLFALHLRGGPRAQRVAATLLMVAVPLMLFARLTVRGATVDATARTLALVALVGGLAALWSIRARAGGRIAHVVGYVGVLAFAPNAPYIMTDLFHHPQDIRLISIDHGGQSLVGNILASIEYGWFLVLGTAAWIALVDVGRDWLRRHRPGLPGWRVLVPISGLMAFGIYLGRIERFHSWHPLGEPRRFLHEVGIALTSPGPLAFTVAWWLVVLVSAAVGLRLLDHARSTEGDGVWRLVVRSSWILTGILLASAPLVPIGYDFVGIDVVGASPVVAATSIALGAALVAWQVLPHPSVPRARRLAVVGAVAVLVVPIGAGLLTSAAIAQWYAQFRGLCEYGPSVNLHGDAC